jgi:6-pyruvoyltetrahydropterin/6-carboxytetrahydropterin synthase
VYYTDSNPTAENIALHLWQDVIPLLFAKSSFRILRIKLYETPNCYVEVK